MNDQPMNFYMPCIFWHDRQGILSIDVFSRCSANENADPVYKIATASMQKEIRVWNFCFDSTNREQQNKNRKDFRTTSTTKKVPIVATEIPEQSETKHDVPQQTGDDSIMFVDQEKDVEKDGGKVTKGIEVLILEEEKPEDAKQKNETQVPLSVEFLSNVEGHRLTTNIVRFSPNGVYIASGDADGLLLVWKQMEQQQTENEAMEITILEQAAEDKHKRKGDPEMDIPPNKENWVRAFRTPIRHDGDVTGLCFSPDSQKIASVSMDDSVAVHHTDTGKRVWSLRGFRHFANGIVWDPRGKYLVTLSTDRKMDVLDAQKGTRLRCCYQVELPKTLLSNNIEISEQPFKIFHDDQLCAFQRGVEFSPCGGVIFAPAAHLEVGANNVYGTFAFLRANLSECRPNALFPALKPTIQVKCAPVLYKLFDGPNFLGLPNRLIFAVLCRDSILLYNSQNESPFAYIENIQYDHLTSIAWTPDGQVLVVSSLEGFNSFITFDQQRLGTPSEIQPDYAKFQQQEKEMADLNLTEQKGSPTKTEAPIVTNIATPKPVNGAAYSLPDSPKLITPRRPRTKKAVLTADNAPKGDETSSKDGDGASNNPNQEPTLLVPRKKPRKIQATPVQEAQPGENNPSNPIP